MSFKYGIAGPIAAVLLAAGCVIPPGGGKPAKTTLQGEPVAAQEGIEPTETAPAGEETLAAIEDFLARTQDFRAPVQAEASKPARTSTMAAAPEPQREVQVEPVAPPVRDAVSANAQISVTDVSVTPTAAVPAAVPALESVSIRTGSAVGSVAGRVAPSRIANGPVELHTGMKSDAADELIAMMKAERDRNRDSLSQWRLRTLLAVLEREAESASLEAGRDAELLGSWEDAVVSVRNYLRNPSSGSESAIAKLDSLRGLINVKSEPRVRNVALCRKVVTFGSYEEMPDEEFVSGRSIQTIVYAEIENLRGREVRSGLFETQLATRLEVLTAGGKSMWHREEPDVVDKCRRPRRDFFVAQRITLPATLPAGDYVLKFSVEDKTSGLLAEETASFTMLSPVSVAKGK